MGSIEPGDKIQIKYSERQPPFEATALTFRQAQQITRIDKTTLPDETTAFDVLEQCLRGVPGIEGEQIERLLDTASLQQVQFVLRALSGNLSEDEEKKYLSLL